MRGKPSWSLLKSSSLRLLEPRKDKDEYIDPNAEPYLKGEEYDGLEGDELPDPELN